MSTAGEQTATADGTGTASVLPRFFSPARCFAALLSALLCSGCGITKTVTLPLKAAGTAVKLTGKATVGAAKLAIPDGDKEQSEK